MIISMSRTRNQESETSDSEQLSSPPSSAIQSEARDALGKLSKSLADLLAHIPGEVQRPAHLQHILGTDYKVSWQIFQIARAENPLAVSHHVPSKVLMRKLTASAVERGVPAKVAGRVDKAVDAFNAVVEAHADDRPAFDAMLASLTGGEAEEAVSIQHRRNAYRSDCPLWGVQTGVMLSQMFTRVSPHGNGTDECYVSLKHKLRLLRQNVMPGLHGFRLHTSEGPITQAAVVALEPGSMATYGAPLLPEFCSQPTPRLLSVPVTDGWTYSVLDSKELGRKGSATVAFSGYALGSPFTQDGKGTLQAETGINAQLTKPTELAVLELFLHRPSFGQASPKFEVIAMGPGGDNPPLVLQQARRLDLHAEVESLGPIPQMSPLDVVPRHKEMTEYVLRKLGWNPAEFDGFRVQVQYPILHSELRLRQFFDMGK